MKGITELDLAEDPDTELTDQNHIGGAYFVRGLARAARLDSSAAVLDLGAGLGGPARLLAYRYGCRVHGIDFTASRCRDARKLTRLVGLAGKVSFEYADFLTCRVQSARYDVLWGQGAWTHVKDKSAFIRQWLGALKNKGRIALEDSMARRRPRGDRERRTLGSLVAHLARPPHFD